MVRMKRQGSGLHTQKLLFLSAAFLVFFLKVQVLPPLPLGHWCINFSSMNDILMIGISFDILHIICFACLDFEKIQREEALDVPPMPPQGRNWKGSVVAPFAGNNMLVLYQCPGKTSDASTSGGQNNSYFVQVLHNEVPLSMPVRLVDFQFFVLSAGE